jgi:hypothetical protein
VDAVEKEMEVEEVNQKVKGNDEFILKNVESIMLEAPKQHPLFGQAAQENKNDMSKDPLVNELRVMRDMVQSCPQIWTYMNGM